MAENCTPGVGQAMADSQLANQKTVQDAAALGLFASMFLPIMDNIAVSRQRHVNAAVADNLAHMAAIVSGQTGDTENQQTTSPAGVAAAETAKGAVATANAQVAANIAEVVSGLSDVVVKFSEAMNALTTQVLSQTQPRSPAAASPTPTA